MGPSTSFGGGFCRVLARAERDLARGHAFDFARLRCARAELLARRGAREEASQLLADAKERAVQLQVTAEASLAKYIRRVESLLAPLD